MAATKLLVGWLSECAFVGRVLCVCLLRGSESSTALSGPDVRRSASVARAWTLTPAPISTHQTDQAAPNPTLLRHVLQLRGLEDLTLQRLRRLLDASSPRPEATRPTCLRRPRIFVRRALTPMRVSALHQSLLRHSTQLRPAQICSSRRYDRHGKPRGHAFHRR